MPLAMRQATGQAMAQATGQAEETAEETAEAMAEAQGDHTIAEATEESQKTLEQNTRLFFGR
ncbi:hypothetical protein HMPREF3216_00655 [Gardnerella vaginalis]|uniref:Uncharacterized protein n=1 Tax=Gardnerella vaginalis TaxID=2702 RepID=A0A133NPL5_GARVA|nr:hypothetical protein HMPREF3216_00655 [Gardnerella vaginalis]